MFPIPIFVPINRRSEPPKCPHCGKEEQKIEVCKWCKYEYPNEPWKWYEYITIPLAVVGSTVLAFSVVVAFIFYILFPIINLITGMSNV